MNQERSEESIERVRKIVARVSTGQFPMNPTFSVGPCTETGLPRVSCQLFAPDVREGGGLRVETGVRAGGIGWPPHSVVLASHDASEREVALAVRASFHKALCHEGDENLTLDGQPIVDAHPAT